MRGNDRISLAATRFLEHYGIQRLPGFSDADSVATALYGVRGGDWRRRRQLRAQWEMILNHIKRTEQYER
ncbi:MAG: hypothetical protein ABFD54_04315 [Armatimonadota bacterium]